MQNGYGNKSVSKDKKLLEWFTGVPSDTIVIIAQYFCETAARHLQVNCRCCFSARNIYGGSLPRRRRRCCDVMADQSVDGVNMESPLPEGR